VPTAFASRKLYFGNNCAESKLFKYLFSEGRRNIASIQQSAACSPSARLPSGTGSVTVNSLNRSKLPTSARGTYPMWPHLSGDDRSWTPEHSAWPACVDCYFQQFVPPCSFGVSGRARFEVGTLASSISNPSTSAAGYSRGSTSGSVEPLLQ
jgi:hypothetical protein